MIRGIVNARLEAKLPLTVISPNGTKLEVDAIIDTGFTGSLVLPTATIAALGLVRKWLVVFAMCMWPRRLKDPAR